MANAHPIQLAGYSRPGFGYRAVRLATALPAVVPPVAVGIFLLLARHNPYWLGAAWGLTMLAAMRGWGLAVELGMRPRRPVDFGLSMAWGLAAMFVVGGAACALHVAVKAFLIAQVVAGLLFALGLGVRRWRPAPSRRRLLAVMARPGALLVALGALVAMAVDFLGLLQDFNFNPSDDPVQYKYFAAKIIQTGTPLDPFNSRRVTLYGGVDYLNALFVSVGKQYQLHVVDGGIGVFLLFALVVGALAPQGLRRANAGHLAIPLLLLVTLGDVHANVGCLVTGAAAFVATYRTLIWIHDERPAGGVPPLADLAALGACVMATSILRPSYAVPTALFVGLALIARHTKLWLHFTWPAVRSALRDALGCGLFCFAFLLPWLIVFHESVGSFVYPLFKGNATPGFAIMKPEPGLAFNLRHLFGDLAYSPIDTSLLLLVAGLAPLGWGERRPKAPADFVVLLSIVCFAGVCLNSYMFGVCDSSIDARYSYAYLVGSIFAIVLSIAPRRPAARDFVVSPRALLVVAAVMIHVNAHHEARKNLALARVDQFERGIKAARESAVNEDNVTVTYRDLQAHIPEHETAVVAVPEPYRFNFRRNTIFSLDAPGGLGPKPGFPSYKGADALADYFLRNGVRYLVTVNFHSTIELLSLDFWPKIVGLPHNYGAYEAPFVVDALKSLEQIVQTHRKVYEGSGMTVTDLRERQPRQPQ